MKQLLLIVLNIFAILTTGYSQKVNVPAAVTKAFNSKYSNATNIKWGKESAKEYEAEFKLNGTNVSANFSTDGTWVETETTINTSDLPATIANTINTKYHGAVIYLVEKIEKPGNKILYEVNIKIKGKKKELEMNPDGSLEK